MSLKTAVVSRIVEYITSAKRQDQLRKKFEELRKRSSARHTLDYFHQVDDPYSHLALQALNMMQNRYEVDVRLWVVEPPEDWTLPERKHWLDYARADCQRLAQRTGLTFTDYGSQPDADLVQSAQHDIGKCLWRSDAVAKALVISFAFWAKTLPKPIVPFDFTPLAKGTQKRAQLGHYMGAMIYYGGEWYWGVDRLHYLEARLKEVGAQKMGHDFGYIVPPPALRLRPHAKRNVTPLILDWYLSFSSPYSYLACARVKQLIETYGIEVRLRFVVPMSMRGLPNLKIKSQYITLDCAREARRLSVPFGRIADPVGRPVERGYAILAWAIEIGRGFEFCEAFLQAVWSQGLDAGSDRDLRRIVETAGLDWNRARDRLNGDAWRAQAEDNRLDLQQLGHWGVPCFVVKDLCVWGQDRLWVVADALANWSH
ncbi:DsbA family protein [Candidatus Phycosocius spiralis]|uniref:2-hydroxychromene-2-carboxylate isomerase n=1 Tax=Candidatus Phycosocius spiralis TaxID=2815099 RepID=A0ABQ4PVM1_9PROT|nr:DsbA family protein [Candidatus Phycosocius spiralis]GIU67021.1 2-hydroxychromene-2-carboxylate isomerase [Candidatus Phycosocius spiralis]